MSETKNTIEARLRIEREKEQEKNAERKARKKSCYKDNIEILNKLAVLVNTYKDWEFEAILNTFVMGQRLSTNNITLWESKDNLERVKDIL